jgi:hypothetical protein
MQYEAEPPILLLTYEVAEADYAQECADTLELVATYLASWRSRFGAESDVKIEAAYPSLPDSNGRSRGIHVSSSSALDVSVTLTGWGNETLSHSYGLHTDTAILQVQPYDRNETQEGQPSTPQDSLRKAQYLQDMQAALFDADTQEQRGNRLP